MVLAISAKRIEFASPTMWRGVDLPRGTTWLIETTFVRFHERPYPSPRTVRFG